MTEPPSVCILPPFDPTLPGLTPPLDATLSGILADGTPFSNRLEIHNRDLGFVGSGGVDLRTPVPLEPGDADRSYRFDQFDIGMVSVAGKYLTGQAATWGEGDWDCAPVPGRKRLNPPVCDGVFDQFDIVAALQTGLYRAPRYAAKQLDSKYTDAVTSVAYDPVTGELSFKAPPSLELTSINIDSAPGFFTGQPAENLGGNFDIDTDSTVFKAVFGASFGSLNFGPVAQTGLSNEIILRDLSVVVSVQGGDALGEVELIYVPEPSATAILVLGLIGLSPHRNTFRRGASCKRSREQGR